MVSTLTNIGPFDNYIVEVRYPDELEDDITDALERNLAEMGASIGDDSVYVKPFDPAVTEDLLGRLDREPELYSMPWLILLDMHPTNVQPGDECMLFELGDIETQQGVTRTLREIREAINDEQFARRLDIQQRLDYMKDVLTRTIKTGGLVITVVSFV